ncbi:hypothetical protein BMG00_11885 [Thioclava marina]|uniref:Uncharacterized protein n=1 Tax=Thioclava marina TaxID=1915077 RepID=A0ABX3MK06_9RHOB|nr:hypothetical protein BMG00_11885 [Thioclava marina]
MAMSFYIVPEIGTMAQAVVAATKSLMQMVIRRSALKMTLMLIMTLFVLTPAARARPFMFTHRSCPVPMLGQVFILFHPVRRAAILRLCI